MSIESVWKRYVHPEVNQYSATTSWVNAQAQHKNLMLLIPKGMKTVLDLGCGDGWSVNELKSRGYDVRGVTINQKEVDHAKKTYNTDLDLMDMHDLGFAAHAFDFVYCRECYEHSVAPYLALCEINRVLVSDGYALIHIPNQDWVKEPSHFSVFNNAQMKEMLRKCFFRLVSDTGTGVGTAYLAQKTKDIV